MMDPKETLRSLPQECHDDPYEFEAWLAARPEAERLRAQLVAAHKIT